MQHSRSGDRPLEGACVMVTRAENPSDPLAQQLRELGAEVVLQPAIRISPPADWRLVDEAIARLNEYDWLVFSSANGVRYFLDRCEERLSTPFPRVAAIGSGTAEELARFGLRADLVPREFRAEALADALINEAAIGEKGTGPICRNGPEGAAHKLDLSPFPLIGRRILLARANRGREVLAERLTASGATVDQIVVYTSSDLQRPDAEIAAMLAAGRIDWITVTSSAIARSLVRMFGDDLRRAKLASISPITGGVLRELGHRPAAEAAEYTLAGLAAAILLFSPV
ncbi:MAG: uroporphyrinogen-III synthase [Planctomycetes bacterium]|nr:uroporphyrinogen-III synthase [Planctomycetota bacterium]MCG2685243.1 uroporphyrinogen-III synthase [Planctomycetales bacterium]